MESVTIRLDPHYELQAEPSKVPAIVQQVVGQPLEHQLRTYQLQKIYNLVLNTFPTGTGKTKAALLHLLDQRQANTLFIAPTNELIDQHCQDINEFRDKAVLDHIVCPVNAKLLREIDSANNLYRQGERFYRLMKNPMEFAEQLGIPEEKRTSRCPVILVTNPDLFYYALYSCYANLDKRNLFEAMFTFFEYIVIDEFHYYNAKQLANFLFFLALSLEFGYFESENRKVCLLSATPDAQVYEYLERLALQGLRWKSIEPEYIEPENPLAVRTLAPVNLTFLGFNDLSDYAKAYTSQIKMQLENSLDGALITNSLIDVNRTVGYLKAAGLNSDRDFGRITGAVSRRERKIAAKKPLIVATPTVDIGYNFVKYNKARQNLDFVVFTARYSDEFWQRLGRTGRVLGKPEQTFMSDAVALVSSEALGKIQESVGDSSSCLTRDQLKQLLVDTKVFSQKPFFHEYISSYSILESFRPLYELRKLMHSEERVKDVFERVRALFAPTSKKGYMHYVASLGRFYALQAAVRGEYSDRLTREFLSTAHFWIKGIEQHSADENVFTNFQKQLQAKNSKSITQIKNYISEEYFALASLFSFRDSFQTLLCAVYDPYNIISDHEEVVYYDLLHLLKNYDLSWYKEFQDFKANCNEANQVQEADLYCRVNRSKSKEESLTVSFSLISGLEPELFRRRYCGKPIAIKGFGLQATQGKNSSIIPMPVRITEAIRDRYITCLLVPEEGGEFGKIQGRTRDMQMPFPSVFVVFPDSKELKFKTILGTNTYLIGARIQKYLYALEKKTEYWIC